MSFFTTMLSMLVVVLGYSGWCYQWFMSVRATTGLSFCTSRVDSKNILNFHILTTRSYY